jgi:hypothetical protein
VRTFLDGTVAALPSLRTGSDKDQTRRMNMRRTITALALSTLFAAAPAFANKHTVAKPVAGDTKADVKPADAAKPADGAEAKPAEKPATKKTPKKAAKKTEKPAEGAAPAEAPAK